MMIAEDSVPPSHVASGSQKTSVLSKLLLRWRSRHGTTGPSSLPEDVRPPLVPSPLPLILPEHQTSVQNLGWGIVTFPKIPSTSSPSVSVEEPAVSDATPGTTSLIPPPDPGRHPLQKAAEDLFRASQTFFALSPTEKAKWKSKLGSEEGWSHIPGEKEFITLRTLEGTPDVLKDAAQKYWNVVGAYLDRCLERIENALGQSSNEPSASQEEAGLRKYVGRCKTMGVEKEARSASMLRLFRYEGVPDGDQVKVVAEPHADLGLLSYVVGDVPGLEVWDGVGFYPVETTFENFARTGAVSNGTLLCGRQLEWLSNGRFPAGGHRVVSFPRTQGSLGNASATSTSSSNVDEKKAYRYSIVFVLRADEEVVVDTDALTTPITGIFAHPIKSVRAGDWYRDIQSAHFNINTGLKEREFQRRKLEELGAGKA